MCAYMAEQEYFYFRVNEPGKKKEARAQSVTFGEKYHVT